MRSALGQRDATLISVLAYAGFRPGEALGLRWVDIRERTLLVQRAISLGEESDTKTGQHRTVRLLAPLAADLRSWRLAAGPRLATELVFPGKEGEPWTQAAYQSWRRRTFNRATRAAGLTHARAFYLRHSFASLLLHEGRSVIYVARQLGHDARLTLTRYGHVIDEFEELPTIDAEAAIAHARVALREIRSASLRLLTSCQGPPANLVEWLPRVPLAARPSCFTTLSTARSIPIRVRFGVMNGGAWSATPTPPGNGSCIGTAPRSSSPTRHQSSSWHSPTAINVFVARHSHIVGGLFADTPRYDEADGLEFPVAELLRRARPLPPHGEIGDRGSHRGRGRRLFSLRSSLELPARRAGLVRPFPRAGHGRGAPVLDPHPRPVPFARRSRVQRHLLRSCYL